MKIVSVIFLSFAISGCAAVDTVKKYWPRDHDPVMFNKLVELSVKIEKINCDQPDWSQAVQIAETLDRYAEWRKDPQKDNIKGLYKHTQKMSAGGSKTFCELGKKTADQRIQAAKTAWEGR